MGREERDLAAGEMPADETEVAAGPDEETNALGVPDSDVEAEPVDASVEVPTAEASLPKAPPDQRVLFVHIPKTAGVSLHLALREWASPERAIRFQRGGAGDVQQLMALSAEAVEDLRLISGHLSYVDFRKRLDDQWLPLAILRDPLERALSLFSFVKNTPAHPWYEHALDMDLDEFLTFDRDRPFAVNQQCMFITNGADASKAYGVLHTQFALACTLEHFGELVERLSAVLEFPLKVARENVSRNRLTRADVGSGTMRLIEDTNGADQQLYERTRDAGLIGYLTSDD